LLGTSLGGVLKSFSHLSLLFFIPTIGLLIENKNIEFNYFIKIFAVTFLIAGFSMFVIYFHQSKIINLFIKILIIHVKMKKNIIISFLFFWLFKVKKKN
jgi:hypothetical protein